jgi:hypothetical protein
VIAISDTVIWITSIYFRYFKSILRAVAFSLKPAFSSQVLPRKPAVRTSFLPRHPPFPPFHCSPALVTVVAFVRRHAFRFHPCQSTQPDAKRLTSRHRLPVCFNIRRSFVHSEATVKALMHSGRRKLNRAKNKHARHGRSFALPAPHTRRT